MMPFWEFSEDAAKRVIVLTLAVKPKGLVKDWIRSAGFRPNGEPLTYVRKADGNGRAAAWYLGKQLRGEI